MRPLLLTFAKVLILAFTMLLPFFRNFPSPAFQLLRISQLSTLSIFLLLKEVILRFKIKNKSEARKLLSTLSLSVVLAVYSAVERGNLALQDRL